MDEYLLDTNVLRELGKTSPHKNVAARLKSVDDCDLAISALTVREIAKGIAGPSPRPGVKRWPRRKSMLTTLGSLRPRAFMA